MLNGWDAENAFIAHEAWTADNSLTEKELCYEQENFKHIYSYLSEEEPLVHILRIKLSKYLASDYLTTTPLDKVSVESIAEILENIALTMED